MIPEDRLSTSVLYDQLVITVDPQPSLLQSREWGGVALNDGTQGLYVQIWELNVVTSDIPAVLDQVWISAPSVAPILIFSALDITEASLAFDQNMHIFVAFVSAGQAKYYWYDTVTESQITSNLPVGSTTPRATLDDHRRAMVATSDIILAYIRDGSLYFRAQIDRYLIEYLLYADINLVIPSPQIHSVSMNQGLRLQFSIRGPFG